MPASTSRGPVASSSSNPATSLAIPHANPRLQSIVLGPSHERLLAPHSFSTARGAQPVEPDVSSSRRPSVAHGGLARSDDPSWLRIERSHRARASFAATTGAFSNDAPGPSDRMSKAPSLDPIPSSPAAQRMAALRGPASPPVPVSPAAVSRSVASRASPRVAPSLRATASAPSASGSAASRGKMAAIPPAPVSPARFTRIQKPLSLATRPTAAALDPGFGSTSNTGRVSAHAGKPLAPTILRPVVYILGHGANSHRPSVAAPASSPASAVPPSSTPLPSPSSPAAPLPSRSPPLPAIQVATASDIAQRCSRRRAFRITLRRAPRATDPVDTPPVPAVPTISIQDLSVSLPDSLASSSSSSTSSDPASALPTESPSLDASANTQHGDAAAAAKRHRTHHAFLVGKPAQVQILREMAEKLLSYQRRHQYMHWRTSRSARSRRQAEVKRKKLENLRIEIITKMRLLHDLKGRFEKVTAHREQLNRVHKETTDVINGHMTHNLSFLATQDASVCALADHHHAAQHAAALAAQRAHQAGTRRLRTLRADRDVKVSDLAELERATTDLHALKQALAQDPRFLVAQVEPVVHAKDKVVETWEADAGRLEAARAGVAERARAEVVETVREHVTVDRNQALSEYFSTVTVPLHTSMERMRAELERQRAEQARLAQEADELEVKLAAAKRHRGRDPEADRELEHRAHARVARLVAIRPALERHRGGPRALLAARAKRILHSPAPSRDRLVVDEDGEWVDLDESVPVDPQRMGTVGAG
ncbi:hypothetical protein GGF32_001000 [Allomyces javanicus]|nr:hypothetical protein GGF32_001000 [Allomyces javanicus]